MKDVDARGRSAPLGTAVSLTGTNFSVFSQNASSIELVFFDREDDAQPSRVVTLDPAANRTGLYWHAFVPGIQSGQLYGYRAQGPFAPDKGMRFDGDKILLDPYARGVVVPKRYSRAAASGKGDNAATSMKSVVVDSAAYDWEGDMPLERPASRTIIYEMHVRGFTRHPSSGLSENTRGTYAGLVEKIPYLKQLGITAVELLPVFQFDAQSAPAGLVNYWGYAPISFFAPHQAYCSRQDALGPVFEFRDMVKALHRAGIEVILDVVFNHTAEGNHLGPTLSFRGLENSAYYILESDPARFADFSGTGNTLSGNHPVVRRMILDSLRYWVEEMHVDGFRFDLAAILERGQTGNLLPNPPVIWAIDSSPTLAGTKLIAEAWDAAGLYRVGNFPGDNWREWNGRFRDDVRSFFRGDDNSIRAFADRVLGSPQIYGHKEREAEASVNFVTCHDGFTLNDLVSYSQKHNEANGEGNHDGTDDNRSYNCGVEGPTADAEVERLRNRQVKNFLTVTLLSFGLPMISMGDEVRRTQLGNNNAYCQDNEISWFDWTLTAKHADVHRFVAILTAYRVMRGLDAGFRTLSLNEVLLTGKRGWHGVKLDEPDWAFYSHSVAYSVARRRGNLQFHAMFNAYWEPLEFDLPPARDGETWRRWIDTSLGSPNDIVEWQAAAQVMGPTYRLGPRSIVILFC
ncbi:MAG TPA: glycogen debranching protein GlgX [Steroidobacteraceae bacterium]